MTAEYPKEAQNPPTIPGARPDEQPEPEVRVPKPNPTPDRDRAGDRQPTTQEGPEAGTPIEEQRDNRG